jgi:pyridoxine/pyridoxamine 5'-phosphate oxidase
MDLNDPFELFKSWIAEAEKKEIRANRLIFSDSK